MAKGKPTRAFLEALQKERQKTTPPDKPGAGGSKGFSTPPWFFNQPGDNAPKPGAPHVGPLTTHPQPSRMPFRFTIFHLAMVGAALLVVVIAAYLLGKKQAPPQYSPVTTEQVRKAPANPAVMNVPGPATAEAVATTPPNEVRPSGPVADGSNRIVGMNYVIIQSYPDEKRATDARDALVKGGIDCTVVKNHPFAPKWYSVIGTRGFSRTNTQEYQDYIRKLDCQRKVFRGGAFPQI